MAFTRAVGSTSLEDGVRVVAVNPGPVETDRLVTLMRGKAEAEHGDAGRWREYLSGMPMGRAAPARARWRISCCFSLRPGRRTSVAPS